MMTFEEMQEKCVKNKEKVNKWSKVLTVVLMASMIYLFHNHGNTIVCEIIFVTSGIILFSNLVFTYKKVLSDRIYSKFPAELGAGLIIIMIAWMVTDISNFREVMKVYDLREVIFLLFEIWLICFLTHCLSIRLLDFTFFSNPTVKYTGKIVELKKGIISNYACFYDFTNELNKVLISAEEYKNWSVGDVIDTVLQVRIDKIEVKKSVVSEK